MKNIMKEAHNLTKKIIRKGDSYKATFRICLSFVHSEIRKGENKMIELKGTEKQVKWANDIRKNIIEACDLAVIEFNKVDTKRNKRMVCNTEKAKEIFLSIEKAVFFIDNFKGFAGNMDQDSRVNSIMRTIQSIKKDEEVTIDKIK